MTTTDQHNTPPLTADSPEWALRKRLAAHSFFTRVRPEHEQAMVDFMLQQQAEAKSAAVREPFGYFKAEPFGWTDCAETDEGAIALYTTPPAAPVQEPVAQALIKALTHAVEIAEDKRPGTWDDLLQYRALLTTPPAAQPAPVPLTDDQIDAEHDKLFPAPVIPGDRAKVRAFVRAIEAAHGITAPAQQGGEA